MCWIIGIIIFLICGVMGEGDKERTLSDRRTAGRTQGGSEGVSAVLADGLRTFDAGMRRVNQELDRKARAGQLLQDFARSNQDAVIHFRLCCSYAQTCRCYQSFLSPGTALPAAGKQSIFRDRPQQGLTAPLHRIRPLAHQDFYWFDFSTISVEDPALLTAVHEKLASILDDTKSELREIRFDVMHAHCQAEFDSLLQHLGERELFHQLTER